MALPGQSSPCGVLPYSKEKKTEVKGSFFVFFRLFVLGFSVSTYTRSRNDATTTLAFAVFYFSRCRCGFSLLGRVEKKAGRAWGEGGGDIPDQQERCRDKQGEKREGREDAHGRRAPALVCGWEGDRGEGWLGRGSRVVKRAVQHKSEGRRSNKEMASRQCVSRELTFRDSTWAGGGA